jgi:adenylate cyclase class IV
MKSDQDSEEGVREVQRIMAQLEITEKDLVTGAYIDLLESNDKSFVAKSGY